MAVRNDRVLKKYSPLYVRVRVSEGSDSDGPSMRSPAGPQLACSTASFTWLHRACSMNGSFGAALPAQQHVPLSESPKRELRMRSATSKVGRQSKKQKKQFLKLWW